MSTSEKIRQAVFQPENPNSIVYRARAKRWDWLLERFPDLPSMTVLDLGGTPSSWNSSAARPAELVTLNTRPPVNVPPWAECVVGDACDPPAELRSRTFDLVYSNSLIEHVGGFARRQAVAEVVRELAPHHWVQTPARSFPIEPHFLFPGFQFLPLSARARILEHWKLRHGQFPSDHDVAVSQAILVELISATEMKFLFPTSEILHERFAGLTKSLIAVL